MRKIFSNTTLKKWSIVFALAAAGQICLSHDYEAERVKIKKKALEKISGKLDEQINQIQQLKTQIEAEVREHTKTIDQQTLLLASIYANMNPKSAADVVNQMKAETASHILSLMPPDLSSRILNHIPVERSKHLSLLILKKLNLKKIDYQSLKLIFNDP